MQAVYGSHLQNTVKFELHWNCIEDSNPHIFTLQTFTMYMHGTFVSTCFLQYYTQSVSEIDPCQLTVFLAKRNPNTY